MKRFLPDRVASRIALAILVAIGSVQVISAAVFVLLHPGPPAVYGFGDVIGAVRTAVAAAGAGQSAARIEEAINGDFDVGFETEAPPVEPLPRHLRRLAGALRDTLPADVTVRIVRPPPDAVTRFLGIRAMRASFVARPAPPPPDGPGAGPAAGQGEGPPEAGEFSVVAWFEVHVGLAPDRWLVLRPPGLPGTRHALLVALLSLGGIGIAVGTLAIFTSRRIVAPLGLLAAAARRFARDRRVTPVPADGPRELREITDAFNEMQRELSRYVDERTRIAAALAHDLRTPLTRLRLGLERTDADDREVMLAAVEHMAGMIDATLAYARHDSAREAEQRVDLAALAQSACDELADLGFEASYAGPARLVVMAQPTALRRAVTNLIENACKHGGSAEVDICQEGGTVRLTVADEGPGVPPEQREAVFEPFTRLDAARSSETAGTGLGLALARAIARAHGGDVVLEGREPRGLVAVLTLPAGAADRPAGAGARTPVRPGSIAAAARAE